MDKQTRKRASKILDAELAEQRENLRKRIFQLVGLASSSSKQTRRIDRIFQNLKDKLMFDGNYSKLVKNADFYSRIESFMDYDKEIITGPDGKNPQTVITSDIDSIIGEVFKAMYILFILTFLDGETEFPLPYLGRLKIREIDRFNPLHKKNVHYFYGRMYLDPALRRDLQRIDKEEKLDIIDVALKQTEKILTEKMY